VGLALYNEWDVLDDDKPPSLYIIRGAQGCNREEGYGFQKIALVAADFPVNESDLANYENPAGGIKDFVNLLVERPPGIDWNYDQNNPDVLSRYSLQSQHLLFPFIETEIKDIVVIYQATLTNSNEYARNAGITMSAKDKNDFASSKSIVVSVPGWNCDEFIKIRGFVWQDLNGNGIREKAEPPIVDALVHVMDSVSNNPDHSDRTGVNGEYELTVHRCCSYKLNFFSSFDLSTDFTIQNANSSAIFDDKDSDVDANGQTILFTVQAPGTSVLSSVDAGVLPKGAVFLGDFVWHDLNGDGKQDEEEPGVENVTVELFKIGEDGKPILIDTKKTDNAGKYRFLVVPESSFDYAIRFTSPENFQFTKNLLEEDQWSESNSSIDSDAFTTGKFADGSSQEGWTFDFEITPNESDLDLDAGLVRVETTSVLPTDTPEDIVCPPQVDVLVSVTSDPDEHAEFVGMPSAITLAIECGSISISGPFPWVDVMGEVDNNGNFFATGTGTVAGFSNIDARLDGSLQNGALNAEYSLGVNGGLPGDAITYSIQGQARESETSSEATSAEFGQVSEFVMLLENYNRTPLPELLASRIHPTLEATYGQEACMAHAIAIADPTLEIALVIVYELDTWDFTLDGISYSIPNVYTVDAVITRNGESSNTETHFGLVDGDLTWFTDCGDPIDSN
jgi:hypothetical protein